jgi:hypothetical protein
MLRALEGASDIDCSQKGDCKYACIDEHSFVIVENIGVVK